MRGKSAPWAAIAALWIAGAAGPLWLINDLSVVYRDFSSMWLAGHAVRRGVPVYDLQALRGLGTELLGAGDLFNYTYPPFALFLAVPFSYLPLTASYLAWNALTAGMFWWAAKPWMPRGLPSILSVLTPAAIVNMKFGQYGLLVGALWLLAFRGSAIAAAVLTLKPHIGFLAALRFARDRRGFALAAAAVAVLAGTSQLVFGGWAEFVSHAVGFQGAMMIENTQPQWFVMETTPRVGFGLIGWLGLALAAAIILARNFNVFSAATATFLISPYGFHYDMTVVCLGLAVLLFSRWGEMPYWEKAVCALGFWTPAIVSFGTWWVPPILITALFVQTKYPLQIEASAGRCATQSFAPRPT